jgi:hypothetical protein
MKKENSLFRYSIIILLLLAFGSSCQEKEKSQKLEANKLAESIPDFQKIRFGFRGESIFYVLNNKEYEVWSTWIKERKVFLDDLDNTDLTNSEKKQIFIDIVDFINKKEGQKPVFCFNSDLESSNLWKQLCVKYANQIQRIDISNTEQENEAFYNSLVKTLERKRDEVHINGFVLKSVEDLNKHWDKIKD